MHGRRVRGLGLTVSVLIGFGLHVVGEPGPVISERASDWEGACRSHNTVATDTDIWQFVERERAFCLYSVTTTGWLGLGFGVCGQHRCVYIDGGHGRR
jgi:hypothetical protein